MNNFTGHFYLDQSNTNFTWINKIYYFYKICISYTLTNDMSDIGLAFSAFRNMINIKIKRKRISYFNK